jgi:hypothetical protein
MTDSSADRPMRNYDQETADGLVADFTMWSESDVKIIKHRFDEDGVLRFLLSSGAP